MTKELAELLDGPVAGRFGRPHTRVGSELRRGKWRDWESDCHAGKQCECSSSDCHMYHADYDDDNPESDALWLAHLLGVCGERGWPIKMCQSQLNQCDGWWFVEVEYNEGRTEECRRSSHLEALARAMLAVPEKP